MRERLAHSVRAMRIYPLFSLPKEIGQLLANAGCDIEGFVFNPKDGLCLEHYACA